jgi:hypothetical protein
MGMGAAAATGEQHCSHKAVSRQLPFKTTKNTQNMEMSPIRIVNIFTKIDG